MLPIYLLGRSYPFHTHQQWMKVPLSPPSLAKLIISECFIVWDNFIDKIVSILIYISVIGNVGEV